MVKERVIPMERKKMLNKQPNERTVKKVQRMMLRMMTKMAAKGRGTQATTWLTSLLILTMVS